MNTHEDNLWQSFGWGEFQKTVGRKVQRFVLEENGAQVASAQVIEHSLPFGFRYWYIPRGPICDAEHLDTFFDKIIAAASKRSVVFVKVDSYVPIHLPKKYRIQASDSVQPETTLIIDLKQEEKEILSHMKQKGRYNIKLAEKRGVQIRRFHGDRAKLALDDFFSLLQETTRRDEFRGHDISYYEKMLKVLGHSAVLIMAYFQDRPIAGGIFTFTGKRAVYYYGVSSSQDREVMAPYLVQWAAIQEAKKRDCTEYDFLGIAPEGERNHPWAGVTEFKKKFGGMEIHYPGAFDIVLRSWWYFALRLSRILLNISSNILPRAKTK